MSANAYPHANDPHASVTERATVVADDMLTYLQVVTVNGTNNHVQVKPHTLRTPPGETVVSVTIVGREQLKPVGSGPDD